MPAAVPRRRASIVSSIASVDSSAPSPPISSSSSARSSDSSAARCSARGVSSPYIQSITNPNCSDAANGDGDRRVSTTRIAIVADGEVVEHARERRHVERVLQHVAIRLDENRERRELPHRLEQVERLEPLQPERHPAPRIAARQEQRARRVHAEARAEQRRRPTSSSTRRSASSARQLAEHADRQRVAEVRQPQHDAVVGRLHLQLERRDRRARLGPARQPFANAAGERHSPRRVHASAERRVQHDAHRAHLVAELLDDERPLVGHDRPSTARCCCTYSTSDVVVASSAS